MKKFIKDMLISILLGILLYGIFVFVSREYLLSDLYYQTIDFLDYFREHFSFFSKDWLYNWNLGLGDSTYSMMIYYLMSPFNILIFIFRSFSIEKVTFLIILCKVIFTIYTSSLLFEHIGKKEYKWIAAFIYVVNIYVLGYGTYQLMWLDTFVFLPVVLIGIERIVQKKSSKVFILSLAVYIIVDYYYAILLIPHIAIYAIIRYFVENGKKGLLKTIVKLFIGGLAGLLLSSVVLVPALYQMMNSAKEFKSLPELVFTFRPVLSVFSRNYIGMPLLSKEMSFTILGAMTFLPYLIFGKDMKKKLYYLPIILVLLAVSSSFFSYILNFFYVPEGGHFRYSIFFNIYVAILTISTLSEIDKNKKLRYALIGIVPIIIALLFMNKGTISKKAFMINIAFILVYSILIWVKSAVKNHKNIFIIALTCMIGLESFIITYEDRQFKNFQPNSIRQDASRFLETFKAKYGSEDRIEFTENISSNLLFAKDIPNSGTYHSLVNKNYSLLGKYVEQTVDRGVIVYFGNRNISSVLTGTKYYISRNNYCPYYNAQLIDEMEGFFIFELDHKEVNFFSRDTKKSINLEESTILKDQSLYQYILVQPEEGVEEITETIPTVPVIGNTITIEENGEYYLEVPYEIPNNDINFVVNSSQIGRYVFIHPYGEPPKAYKELYIGYLKAGDVLTFDEVYAEGCKIHYIKEDVLLGVEERNSHLEIEKIEKNENKYQLKGQVDQDGYLVLPIMYDEGWDIYTNNQPAKTFKADGGFIGIEVENGNVEINMTYHLKTLTIGLSVTGVTILALAVIWGIELKRKVTSERNVVRKRKKEKRELKEEQVTRNRESDLDT